MTATAATLTTTTSTTAVERVTVLAEAAGMTVTLHAPYGQTFELEVRETRCGCPECTVFGAVVFSRRTGAVVRAHLTYGVRAYQESRTYEGAAAVTAALRALSLS